MCLCDYLRFLRKDAGSLASSVLTRPNSCMTLSSCLRSSWPFSRNMNSWPLLPAEGAAETRTTFRNPKAFSKTHDRPGPDRPDDELLGEARMFAPLLLLLLLFRQKKQVGGSLPRLIKGTFSGCSPLSPHLMIVLGGNERLNIRGKKGTRTHRKKHKTHSSAGKCVPPSTPSAQMGKCGS